MKDLTQLLEALDAKRRAATPGPWTWHPTGLVPGEMAALNILHSHNHTPYVSHANAAYIAALDPATVGALIDCVRAAIETRSRADDYADSYISRPVRDALAALASRLGGGK